MTMMNTPTRTEQHRALTIASLQARIAKGENPEDAYRKVWRAMIAKAHEPVVRDTPEPQPVRTFKPVKPSNFHRNERARKLGIAIGELTGAGYTADYIAAQLGCSVSSVERHRKAIRRAAMPKPGPERDAAIMAMHGEKKSTREIAKEVGVTLEIVRWTFERHNVKPHWEPTKRRRFAEDVKRAAARRPMVAELRANGLSNTKIADALGLSVSTVKSDFAWMAAQARKAEAGNRPEWMAGE